jgi:molybdenum cofactor cytidylyltransferase
VIWAVILAAGESKRMGGPKLTLPYKGRTILESVVETALLSPVDGTLVVLGAYEDRIRAVLAGRPLKLAVNRDYKTGMLSSVRCGVRHLPRRARAALIFLGDQPGLSPDTVSIVLGAYRDTKKGLVLPARGRAGGHPLLIDMKYREEIEALDPAIGLRALLALHPEDVERVEAGDDSLFFDIDTPEDYRLAVSAAGSTSNNPIK